jgi:hypothetical protein
MVGWPAPAAEWRTRAGMTEAIRPEFRFIYPDGKAPDPVLAQFRATLPAEIARLLEPFPAYQWNLLELMAARREAIQLASHNPVLAWLLANNDHFRNNLTKPPVYLAQWRLDYTQERLLDWLGFPPATSVMKLFRKIDPTTFSLATARLLRIALNGDPSLIPLLAHQRKINRGILSLVILPQCRAWLSPSLLEAVSSQPDGPACDDPGERLLGLVRRIESARLPVATRKLRTLRQLERLADEVAEEEQRLRDHRAAQRVLAHTLRIQQQNQLNRERATVRRELARANAPPDPTVSRLATAIPPPPDTDVIIRLQTKEDAAREGKEQQNCVGSQALSVAAGLTIIYRVLHPERATLELRMGRKGEWFVVQLKRARNEAVAPPTRAYVEHWLANYHLAVARRRARTEKRLHA